VIEVILINMIIDLHCHTKYSGDSTLEPEALFEIAREKGLDGVCITEHDSFLASEPAEEAAKELDFRLFRGAEINTNCGHILAFGVKDDDWRQDGYYSHIDFVRKTIHGRHAILIPSHPFRTVGSASAQLNLYSMDFIAAMEVLNGENNPRENELALKAWKQLKIPGTGGSDCHFAGRVGACATWFEYPVETIDELIEEIRAGRVAPVFRTTEGVYKLQSPTGFKGLRNEPERNAKGG
jgi:hypothetical protein